MIGTAQTIDKPIIISPDVSPQNKVWCRYDDVSTITYFSNTNRTHAIAYTNVLAVEFMGELDKPDSESNEDGMEIYEWGISYTKVLQLVLREECSLIVNIDTPSE